MHYTALTLKKLRTALLSIGRIAGSPLAAVFVSKRAGLHTRTVRCQGRSWQPYSDFVWRNYIATCDILSSLQAALAVMKMGTVRVRSMYMWHLWDIGLSPDLHKDIITAG